MMFLETLRSRNLLGRFLGQCYLFDAYKNGGLAFVYKLLSVGFKVTEDSFEHFEEMDYLFGMILYTLADESLRSIVHSYWLYSSSVELVRFAISMG